MHQVFIPIILSLALFTIVTANSAELVITPGQKKLPMLGESFQIDGNDAFVILPSNTENTNIPWIWYAPTLTNLPGGAEVWMFQQFLAKGVAIAGIDIGESFGNLEGRTKFSDFHLYLTTKRGFRQKPCLMARSRGGLMLYNWAVENPDLVSGVVGIYPVCNVASYPGIPRAAAAYGMTPTEFETVLTQHNPVDRLKPLAEAGVPIHHIHGDNDKIVPLEANSARLAERYRAFEGSVKIEVVPNGGHDMWEGWFRSQKLTDFAIARALGKPLP